MVIENDTEWGIVVLVCWLVGWLVCLLVGLFVCLFVVAIDGGGCRGGCNTSLGCAVPE